MSMRLLLLAVFWLAFWVASAAAAERAQFDLIGFSPDGRYFAFEEYGIQDGSGFAYSSIFVIDLSEDSWAAGPFRHRADDEATDLASIRTAALTEAAPVLAEFNVTTPPVIIALNGDGETATDGLALEFGVPGYSEPGHMFGDYSLSLEIFKAPSPQDCIAYLGQEPMGFGLILTSDGVPSEIYRDNSIPNSRGCPTTYRISAVVLPFEAYDLEHAVALISVYAFGFEGVDRRFVAVRVTAPAM